MCASEAVRSGQDQPRAARQSCQDATGQLADDAGKISVLALMLERTREKIVAALLWRGPVPEGQQRAKLWVLDRACQLPLDLTGLFPYIGSLHYTRVDLHYGGCSVRCIQGAKVPDLA